MARGQAFLGIPDRTSRGKIRHLNVIITEPDDENVVLVVPVCTYHERNGVPLLGIDSSCLLPAGSHPFIKVTSYISYRNAMAMSLISIINGLNKGKLIRQQNIDIRFVQDMQRGAEESPFLPEKLKRFFHYFH